MTTKTDTEQLRAEFEAWANGRCELYLVNPAGRYSSATTQFAWEAYQAGRAALKAQNADAGLDVEAVLRLFLTGDGFIAECDIPHIVAALQSQDREKHLVAAIREAIELLGPEAPLCSGCEYEWNHALRVLREAIDHARRVEGGKS